MAVSLHARFLNHLARGIDDLQLVKDFPADLLRAGLTVERPRDPLHGDLSTNAAMVLAKLSGTHPRQLAEKLADGLAKLEDVAAVDVAGPGFINIRLTDQAWRNELAVIADQKDQYGMSPVGAGKTVNIEFVSANPTGPMHMGHCRSEMRSPTCSLSPAIASSANIISMMPAGRSMFSLARHTRDIARRWARASAR